MRLVDKGIARELRRFGVGAIFGFLNRCNGDGVFVDVVAKIVDFAGEAVAVPLKDDGRR